MQTIDHVEVSFAALSSDQAAYRDITRTQPPVERGKFGLRLDYNALPSALVEPERHIVRDRMSRADIDIRTGRLSREGKGEMIILEIL